MAHTTTRLTRTADGVVATEGLTEGVHGVHGETLTLAPEPTSGTGLHGEKLGAARTHEPNRQVSVGLGLGLGLGLANPNLTLTRRVWRRPMSTLQTPSPSSYQRRCLWAARCASAVARPQP